MKNGGSLGRRTLIKNLHVDHGTFRHVTLTVHMCDMILEERISDRKYVYRPKDAA